MATRRMRIKAVINVPRSTAKSEPVEQSAIGSGPPDAAPPSSPLPVMPPRIRTPESTELALPDPPSTPPPPSPSSSYSVIDRIPTSPKSPRGLQRPSPSKSPACLLPASGTILRRSPSPALSRLTNSPGPPTQYPPSPVKSPGPIQNYTSPSSPLKMLSRSPVVIVPTMMVQTPSSSGRNTPVINSIESIKSPPSYQFRPPPSPSPSHHNHHDFHPINSPGSPANSILSRPSPSQSPVLGGGSSRGSTTSFLYHHLNSNSNSADSHEVAQLMSSSEINAADRDKKSTSRGSGAFSSVSNKVNSTPSPSFSKTMFEDPESLKRRLDEKGKKEVQATPSKFSIMRKEFYEKLHSGNLPAKLTMLHYTFYNPPDPNGTKAKRKSRSRASSICSDVSTLSKQGQDAPTNNENKAASAPSSIAGSRRTTASSVGSAVSAVPSEAGQSDHGSVKSNASAESTESNVPGPRVKVGPNGELIIDEKSLVVETSESQRARQQIENMEVVLGSETSGMYRYRKSFRRGIDWTEKETIKFYRALNQCGTDFSMMLNLFPGRTRHELKCKFKREDKKNPDMISMALQSCVFDPSEQFSDDEEEAQLKTVEGMTEKEKLLDEEKEVEEVVCSADGNSPKKKKVKKEKDFQFSMAQLQEINKTRALFKGPGTGKGRKWNTPVIGLEGTKLPTEPKKVKIKLERDQIEKKKKGTKKKKDPPISNSVPTPGAVSIIIAPGVLSAPILPMADFKQEKTDLSTDIKNSFFVTAATNAEKGKKRVRLPKTKPNVVAKDVQKKAVKPKVPKERKPTLGPGMCDDLFRLDAPAPLPTVQETELIGDEEGSEGLVIVDLDELKSLQTQASEEINITFTTSVTIPVVTAPTTSTASAGESKRRKRKKVTPVTVTKRIIGDPYGKTTLTTTVMSSSSDDAKAKSVAGTTGDVSSSKKVKVLPYRVPGPGGTTTSSAVADELEIEIELNTANASNNES